MVHTIVAWLVGVVAVVGFFAGAPAAAQIAGNALGTIGITAGSLAGGSDNLIDGFNRARQAAGDAGSGGLFGPDKPKPQRPAKQRNANR